MFDITLNAYQIGQLLLAGEIITNVVKVALTVGLFRSVIVNYILVDDDKESK